MYFAGTLVVSLKKRLVAFSFQGTQHMYGKKNFYAFRRSRVQCVALVTCHCTNMLVVTPQHWKYACSWFPFKVWHIAKSAKKTLCKTPTAILFAYTDNFSIFDCIDLCVLTTLHLPCRAWLKHSATWLWLQSSCWWSEPYLFYQLMTWTGDVLAKLLKRTYTNSCSFLRIIFKTTSVFIGFVYQHWRLEKVSMVSDSCEWFVILRILRDFLLTPLMSPKNRVVSSWIELLLILNKLLL